ncbi:PREDICTED: uncharacterized protein LOC108363741 [Rhagoletis zephyria]|uniref:uncharacterized protein LOC108363741 n=1 Tax=Rhagoletis zephyria TaxID=28612 RepID=UPI0008117FCA|nr:PREDICTED: uncharacterized protein LOC108363741 [Rhagoletis zephyria]
MASWPNGEQTDKRNKERVQGIAAWSQWQSQPRRANYDWRRHSNNHSNTILLRPKQGQLKGKDIAETPPLKPNRAEMVGGWWLVASVVLVAALPNGGQLNALRIAAKDTPFCTHMYLAYLHGTLQLTSSSKTIDRGRAIQKPGENDEAKTYVICVCTKGAHIFTNKNFNRRRPNICLFSSEKLTVKIWGRWDNA